MNNEMRITTRGVTAEPVFDGLPYGGDEFRVVGTLNARSDSVSERLADRLSNRRRRELRELNRVGGRDSAR